MIKKLLSVWRVPVLISCKRNIAKEPYIKKSFTDFDDKIEFVLIYKKCTKWYDLEDLFKIVEYTIKNGDEILYQSNNSENLNACVDWFLNLNSIKFKNKQWAQISCLEKLVKENANV